MKFPTWLEVRGNTDYRGQCPSESAEQVTFFNQLPAELRAIAIHPRNEGKRNHQQAAKHKAEGLTPGAADIIIPGAPTFVCELKRLDHTKSRWQSGQVDYLEACHAAGCFVCVALGWEAAMDAVREWHQRSASIEYWPQNGPQYHRR